MSLAQTTANNQIVRIRPAASATQRKASDPAAIQSVPKAAHSASASRVTLAMIAMPRLPARAIVQPAPDPNASAPTAAKSVAMMAAPVRPSRPRPQSRAHSHPIPITAASTRSVIATPPAHTAASAIGAKINAEMIRSLSALGLAGANGGAVTAFAAVIVAQGLLEIGLAEIGPERVDEHQFRIGRLPQQEIADALLAAGANDEVGIGDVDGEEVAREERFVHLLGRDLARLHCGSNVARRARDLGAAAVGERDGQAQAGICCRERLGIVDERDDVARQSRAVTDDAQAHALGMELGDLSADVVAEQTHEVVHLARRPLPVLRRKSEEREIGDTEFSCRR